MVEHGHHVAARIGPAIFTMLIASIASVQKPSADDVNKGQQSVDSRNYDELPRSGTTGGLRSGSGGKLVSFARSRAAQTGRYAPTSSLHVSCGFGTEWIGWHSKRAGRLEYLRCLSLSLEETCTQADRANSVEGDRA